MKKTSIQIQYNSPVVLTFSFLSLLVLGLAWFTQGATNDFFMVYRAPLSDPFTYFRFFSHVLGHADYSHYIGNIMFILVLGPSLEEKYGSKRLLMAILITAFVSGLVQFILFPNTALLGASGIVFMMILMASLAGMRGNTIPLTLILVGVFYIGGEIINGFAIADNVSQMTHIVGGICGAVIGFAMSGRK